MSIIDVELEALALSRAFTLLAAAADPKSTKARLQQITDAMAEHAATRDAVKQSIASHEADLARLAGLDARDAQLTAAERDLLQREQACQRREAAIAEREAKITPAEPEEAA
jgi:hypothetical protein